MKLANHDAEVVKPVALALMELFMISTGLETGSAWNKTLNVQATH
jgi:hypothetical protein